MEVATITTPMEKMHLRLSLFILAYYDLEGKVIHVVGGMHCDICYGSVMGEGRMWGFGDIKD